MIYPQVLDQKTPHSLTPCFGRLMTRMPDDRYRDRQIPCIKAGRSVVHSEPNAVATCIGSTQIVVTSCVEILALPVIGLTCAKDGLTPCASVALHFHVAFTPAPRSYPVMRWWRRRVYARTRPNFWPVASWQAPRLAVLDRSSCMCII